MSIKAIGFDIGGVIFPDLDFPFENKIPQKLGISPKVSLQIFEEMWEKLATGKATEDELWRRLIQQAKEEVSVKERSSDRRFAKFLVKL